MDHPVYYCPLPRNTGETHTGSKGGEDAETSVHAFRDSITAGICNPLLLIKLRVDELVRERVPSYPWKNLEDIPRISIRLTLIMLEAQIQMASSPGQPLSGQESRELDKRSKVATSPLFLTWVSTWIG